MTNKHLIGKQVLLLHTDRQKNAFALQQQFCDTYRRAIVPAMERLFDRLSGPELYIRLDKVEIDLCIISPKDLCSDALAERIAEQLEKWIGVNLENVPGASVKTQAIHLFEQWLYWLEHGTMPESGTTPESGWLEHVLQNLGLEPHAVEQLHALLSTRPVALRRLVLQHDSMFLQTLVELFTGHKQAMLPRFIALFHTVQQHATAKLSSPPFRQLEIAYWTEIIKITMLKREKLPATSLIAAVQADASIAMLLSPFVKIITSEKVYSNEPLARLILKPRNSRQQTKTEKVTENEPSVKVKVEKELTPAPENCFIENAGIVLIHPFLPRFFTKLDLLDGNHFKDENARHKAVVLLHYLATGLPSTPDYNLVLPKLLCDMPINLSIDHYLTPDKAELEAADDMLFAAIEHWEVLGNTSPDGLREGFLQRSGKLEMVSGARRLQI
ncbi:MAG: hypothetical protein IT262_16300, partial [Saprospiraceae bacterium]|nr:hypothetical protein [Saprospiraceae bacterium]